MTEETQNNGKYFFIYKKCFCDFLILTDDRKLQNFCLLNPKEEIINMSTKFTGI